MVDFPAVTVCNVNPLVKNKQVLENDKFWKPFIEIEKEESIGKIYC